MLQIYWIADFAYAWGLIMRHFRSAALAAVAVIGVASVAFAADLPTKAPVYKAPVAVTTWTGFYVGVQAGYGWENDPTYNYIPSLAMDPSVSFGMRGFVGGGTAGYNSQIGALVLGVEGDISYSDVNGSVLTVNTAPCFEQGCTARLSWFSTGRLRAGYAFGDWLPYITGGGAVGEIKGSADIGACNPATTCAFDETRWGWTAGGGLEYQFYRNWSAKVEYLYMNFGSPSFNAPNLTSSNFAVNIVRGGVNLHF
jgi:outer membrane immunogenic protein